MKRKLKVAILMGGFGAEREISLMSGQNVLKNLNKRRFIGIPVVIKSRNPSWLLGLRQTDAIFVALHGTFGEDGTAQGLLELLNIPYTGSGILASALGMDKIMFRKIMEREGIPIPRYFVIKQGESPDKVWKFFKKPPVFVKPHNQGSSVGASIVRQKSDLQKALSKAFKYSSLALVEEYLKGVEVTCGILGNETPEALPVTEIVPQKEFFDYEAKYDEKLCDEITPARIPRKLIKEVQDLSLRVFKVIGARGFARVDLIINKGVPIVLEINTIPGLTPVSLLPKQAVAAGIQYPKLIEKIIKFALEGKGYV